MPSPVGHFLGGAIVGVLLAPGTTPTAVGSRQSAVGSRGPVVLSHTKRLVSICAIVACLPDLDFLWGRHSMETHSLGAAVVAGLVALALTRGRDPRLALAVVIAWASHVLLDWLGSDTTPPLGVMALWPWSSEYYFSNAFIFEAISRRYWLDGFWRHNILAVVSEVLLLGPPLVVLRWWRVRRAGRLGRG